MAFESFSALIWLFLIVIQQIISIRKIPRVGGQQENTTSCKMGQQEYVLFLARTRAKFFTEYLLQGCREETSFGGGQIFEANFWKRKKPTFCVKKPTFRIKSQLFKLKTNF